VAVITNLELDHHSRWGSLAELAEAFAAFAAPAAGLVTGAEVRLPGREGQRIVRFALESAGDAPQPEAELLATAVRAEPSGTTRFRAGGAGIDAEVSLRVPGLHNVANALAALGGMALAGFDADTVTPALGDFPGVARRLELKGERNGARIYDDYAHHPTEVAAAIQAARELGARRVIAAFQPHLYSRTKALAPELGEALAAADEVAVLDVYPAREEPVGPLAGVSGLMVAAEAADRAHGGRVWWLPTAEQAAQAIGPRLAEGDLLITIGAGDIHKLAEALVDGGADR
jgi:UDP-N-acetylmuramate--alanine ligase